MSRFGYIDRGTYRAFKDGIARTCITAGGWCVVVAITLIFVYLLSVILPLFQPATVTTGTLQQSSLHQYPMLYAVSDEYKETIAEVYADGSARHYSSHLQGFAEAQIALERPISSFAKINNTPSQYIWGTKSGQIVFVENTFKLTYPDDKRLVIPVLHQLFAEDEYSVSESPINLIAGRKNDETLLVVTYSDNQLNLNNYTVEETLDETETLAHEETTTLFDSIENVKQIHITNDNHWLLVAQDKKLIAFSLDDSDEEQQVIAYPATITNTAWLLGESTLIVGDETGSVAKVFYTEGQWRLIERQKVSNHPITNIASEQQRRVFLTMDALGVLAMYYAPSFSLLKRLASPIDANKLYFTPRGDGLLLYGSGQQVALSIDNPHPEINWKSPLATCSV